MRQKTEHLSSYAKNLLNKYRFGGMRRLTMDALAKTGIKIFLYYRILERAEDVSRATILSDFKDYELDFLSQDDMREMAAIPLRNRDDSEDELRHRLEQGMKCIGARHRGRLVSYAWCRFDYGDLLELCRPLKRDEAYLFDVFTVMEYRGKGLAAYLGYHLGKALQKERRSKLISITNLFNKPYISVKKKLNAQIIEKGLLIILFGRYRYHKILGKDNNLLYPMLNCLVLCFQALWHMDQC